MLSARTGMGRACDALQRRRPPTPSIWAWGMRARPDGVSNTCRRPQARGGARPYEATVTSAKIGKAILSHRAKVPMT